MIIYDIVVKRPKDLYCQKYCNHINVINIILQLSSQNLPPKTVNRCHRISSKVLQQVFLEHGVISEVSAPDVYLENPKHSAIFLLSVGHLLVGLHLLLDLRSPSLASTVTTEVQIYPGIVNGLRSLPMSKLVCVSHPTMSVKCHIEGPVFSAEQDFCWCPYSMTWAEISFPNQIIFVEYFGLRSMTPVKMRFHFLIIELTWFIRWFQKRSSCS